MKTLAIVAALVLWASLPCQAQRVFKVRRIEPVATSPPPVVWVTPTTYHSEAPLENRPAPVYRWMGPVRGQGQYRMQCGPNGCRSVRQW